MRVLSIKKTICLCLGIMMAAAFLGACRSRKITPYENALAASGIAPFYIDGALINLDSIAPPPPLAHPERLAMIEDWVYKSNSWYLPFIVRYLPALKTEGHRRLLPMLGSEDSALLTVINNNDIEINLVTKEWTTSPDPLTINLRSLIIKIELEKQMFTQPKIAMVLDEKSNIITEIYRAGVPAYLSSFGGEIEGSALGIALDGNRSEIERYFDFLRTTISLAGGLPPQRTSDDTTLDKPIRRDDASRLVGLWISYRVESALGSDLMIDAINAGPSRLYELYLSTNPGILRSLEVIPEEVKPLPNDSITH